jgi:hypothetical protein
LPPKADIETQSRHVRFVPIADLAALAQTTLICSELNLELFEFYLYSAGPQAGVEALMRWYRSNRKFAGSLALFALALQMTLAFGHIHLRDFAGMPGVANAQAQAPPSNSGGGNRSGHPSDDYCLICATANLAGTLMVPASVALVVPIDTTDTAYAQTCSTVCRTFDYALFRARGPPLA